MDEISDLNDLRLFTEVVERGSFTAAARVLGSQTSKLSRRVRALEEELGVRLLNRTSRSLSLTETGRQFNQHCLALVAEARAAKEVPDQTRTKPQGTVRISCPPPLLSSGIAEIVSRYALDNPDVQLMVDATNRFVTWSKKVWMSPFEYGCRPSTTRISQTGSATSGICSIPMARRSASSTVPAWQRTTSRACASPRCKVSA